MVEHSKHTAKNIRIVGILEQLRMCEYRENGLVRRRREAPKKKTSLVRM